MQELNVSHELEQSSRVRESDVPIVGAKSDDDRGSHQRTEFVAACRSVATRTSSWRARKVERLLKAMKFSATDSAFIATTVSELARALLAHTVFGEICLHKVHDGERSGMLIVMRVPMPLEMVRGPRREVASNFALPGLHRLVDEFDVVADGSDGTTIRATKWCRQPSRGAEA